VLGHGGLALDQEAEAGDASPYPDLVAGSPVTSAFLESSMVAPSIGKTPLFSIMWGIGQLTENNRSFRELIFAHFAPL
jgi:hypothetical protein